MSQNKPDDRVNQKSLDDILNEYVRREELPKLPIRTGEWREVRPGSWQYIWHDEVGNETDSPYMPKAGDFHVPIKEQALPVDKQPDCPVIKTAQKIKDGAPQISNPVRDKNSNFAFKGYHR